MSDNFYKLGLGTWGFGGKAQKNPNNDDEKDIIAIQNAIKAGIKHFDTAPIYAEGKSEELLGEAIKDFKDRELFIASKVSKDISHDAVLKSAEASLQRLQLDSLDLFYVHRPDPQIPVSETAKAVNKLKEQGLIKNFGICNATVETMEEYNKHLDMPIFASQCHYNLIAREPERRGVLNYCRDNNIKFVAWRPIQLPAPSIGIESLMKKGVYPLLDALSDKYDKTNAQIALRWLTQQDNVHLLFKAASPEHLRQNVESMGFDLTPDDMRKLTKEFPLQKDESFYESGAPMPLL